MVIDVKNTRSIPMFSLRPHEICAVLALVAFAVIYAEPQCPGCEDTVQPSVDSSKQKTEEPASPKKGEFSYGVLYNAVVGQCRGCDFNFTSVTHMYEVREHRLALRPKRQASRSAFDRATTFDECNAILDNISRLSTVTCGIYRQYVKCAVRVQGLHLRNLSNRYVEDYEDRIETALLRLGAVCDLDVDGLIEELRFARARTGSGCNAVLEQEIRQANSVECDTVRAWVKCLLRVNQLHRQNLSPRAIAELENLTEANLQRAGIFCDARVQQAIDQLREEDNIVQVTITLT